MIKCASNRPSPPNDRTIRNTLIIQLIEQRARIDGSPLKIIENEVARFLGHVGQPQSTLGYMRVKLWPDQRAHVVMVAAACHRLAVAPSYARCSAQWFMTQIMARVMGGWAGKIMQILATNKAAAAARIESRLSKTWRRNFGEVVAVGIATNCRMVVDDCLAANPACVDAKCSWTYSSEFNSPLIMAIKHGNFEIFDLLLQCGADVNIKDDKGNTALMKAATSGKLEFCDLLLRSNADVNAKGETGTTSLIKSAANGHVDIVKLLVACNADVAVRDRCRKRVASPFQPHFLLCSRGKTAFTHALENNREKGGRGLAIRDGYAEVIAYLKSIKAPR